MMLDAGTPPAVGLSRWLERARDLLPRTDLSEVVAACHGRRHVAVRRGPVTQLPGVVAPPAIGGARGSHAAGVFAAGVNLRERESRNWFQPGAIRGRSIAELAVQVCPPAGRAAVGAESARVMRSRADLAEGGSDVQHRCGGPVAGLARDSGVSPAIHLARGVQSTHVLVPGAELPEGWIRSDARRSHGRIARIRRAGSELAESTASPAVGLTQDVHGACVRLSSTDLRATDRADDLDGSRDVVVPPGAEFAQFVLAPAVGAGCPRESAGEVPSCADSREAESSRYRLRARAWPAPRPIAKLALAAAAPAIRGVRRGHAARVVRAGADLLERESTQHGDRRGIGAVGPRAVAHFSPVVPAPAVGRTGGRHAAGVRLQVDLQTAASADLHEFESAGDPCRSPSAGGRAGTELAVVVPPPAVAVASRRHAAR